MAQPATDEQVDYLEQYDFETLSRRVALELLARIRADEARAAQQELEWRAKFSEQDNEIEGLREKIRAAEARTIELAKEAVRIRTAKFSAIEDELEILRARNVRLMEALKSLSFDMHANAGEHLLNAEKAGKARGSIMKGFADKLDAALSASDAQAGALWTLGRELIEWAANEHNAAFLDDHYYCCGFCNESGKRVHDRRIEHKLGCLHVRAVAEQALKGEPK